MCRDAKLGKAWGLLLTIILFAAPVYLASQTSAKGNLVGFVYGMDGSTPLAGAVVMVRNVTTGTVFESTKSDTLGVFKLEGLGAGIYALGVSSSQGSFNSQDFVGIAPNETAKISISLNPYDAAAAQAAEAVTRDQRDKGESFVGRVVTYSPQNKEAEVFIERGLVQTGDRIRIKGGTTDFTQDAKGLKEAGVKTRRIVAGETGTVPVSRACATGDLVYVVCKRGVPPFFLAPLGIAAITGATGLTGLQEENPVSPASPRVKR